MVTVYVLFGMFAGLVSFIAAIFLGVSFWSALLLYSLVGAVLIVLIALACLALSDAWARNLPKRQASRSLGSDSASEPLTSMALGGERALKILAVDDDAFILELIPKIAARVGCSDITTASSATDALVLLEESVIPFDCLLLDINMPGMDGSELCARIRNMSAYRDTPIIMLTAQDRLDGQRDEAEGRSGPYATISAGLAVRPGSRNAKRAQVAFESAINFAKDRAAGKQGALRSGLVGPSGR